MALVPMSRPPLLKNPYLLLTRHRNISCLHQLLLLDDTLYHSVFFLPFSLLLSLSLLLPPSLPALRALFLARGRRGLRFPFVYHAWVLYKNGACWGQAARCLPSPSPPSPLFNLPFDPFLRRGLHTLLRLRPPPPPACAGRSGSEGEGRVGRDRVSACVPLIIPFFPPPLPLLFPSLVLSPEDQQGTLWGGYVGIGCTPIAVFAFSFFSLLSLRVSFFFSSYSFRRCILCPDACFPR